MSIEIEGIEELEAELQGLADRLEQSGGEIPMDDLFTEDFMESYTEFDSIEAFLDESPWYVESESDFESIPADDFDVFVDEHTDFDSWETMVQAAGREYVLRQAARS